MTDSIKKLMKRTTGYAYRDGLAEIALGLLWLLTAMAQWLVGQAGANGNRTAVIALALGMVVLVMGGAFGTKWVLQALKERVTYPRTGYVEVDPKNPAAQRFVLLMGMVVIVVAFVGTEYNIAGLNQISTSMSLMFATVAVYFGLRTKTPRFYLVALATLGAGVGVVFLAVSEFTGSSIVIAVSGVALLLTGGFALIRYLRENPRIEAE